VTSGASLKSVKKALIHISIHDLDRLERMEREMAMEVLSARRGKNQKVDFWFDYAVTSLKSCLGVLAGQFAVEV
jgi:hypothetical protein